MVEAISVFESTESLTTVNPMATTHNETRVENMNETNIVNMDDTTNTNVINMDDTNVMM